MSKSKRTNLKSLSDWDWTVLVGAWRYYEHRKTIASVMFPHEIVEQYWGAGNGYGDEVRDRIAHQFATVDHGLRGAEDWKDATGYDKSAWETFYHFCEAWGKGFTKLLVSNPDRGGKEEVIEAFFVEGEGVWKGKEAYIEHGEGWRVAEECIKGTIGSRTSSDSEVSKRKRSK